MRILIYGLSANPPTGIHGHLGICAYFAALFDQVWVLPVYQHIFSTKSHLIPFEHRFTMCQRLFQPPHLNASTLSNQIYQTKYVLDQELILCSKCLCKTN